MTRTRCGRSPASLRRQLGTGNAAGQTDRRAHVLNALPWLWLGLSAVWAVVIFATDQVAWPLAVWIATTVGPLTALKTRLDPDTDPQRSNQ